MEAQRDEFLLEIANLKRDIDESAEKAIRFEIVEKAYKSSRDKVTQLSNYIKQLKEENEQLSKIGKNIFLVLNY